MRLLRILRAALVSACLLTASVQLASAQAVGTGHETSAESVASYALSQQMPIDPEVLVGALPNGLRLYVRPNAKPAREAELRLVVKAGSVLEEDDQRGLAEWRMNLGASERVADKVRRVQLDGSRYADRPPIGSPDVIEHARRDQLLRFYRDWYRPDLIAVIVVGDVDREAVRQLIVRHF